MKFALCVKLCQHNFTIVMVVKFLYLGHCQDCAQSTLLSLNNRSIYGLNEKIRRYHKYQPVQSSIAVQFQTPEISAENLISLTKKIKKNILIENIELQCALWHVWNLTKKQVSSSRIDARPFWVKRKITILYNEKPGKSDRPGEVSQHLLPIQIFLNAL